MSISSLRATFVLSSLFWTVLNATPHLQAQSDQVGASQDAEETKPAISEQIVVTANRHASPIAEVGSSVTVIDAAEIERRGKTTVADLLRTVSGLAVARSGGEGQVTSVFLRGGSSSQTLVLLDGVRLNNATTAAFDFADLSTDNIERIEIVRGPQSTLYGSEAMAGVISITTKKGDGDLQVRGLAEAGNLGLVRASLGVSGATERFDYAISAASYSFDGVSAAEERAGNSEDDGYDNTTLSSRMGWAFAGDGRLELSLRSFSGDVEIDGFGFGVGPVDALNARQKRDGTSGDLRFEKIFGRVRQTVSASLYDERLRGEDPDDPFGNFLVDSQVSQLTAQSDIDLAKNDVLTLGYSVEKREGVSRGNFDESLYLRSFFLQNTWSYDERLFLTVGARNDNPSELGDETTYRATVAWLFPGHGNRLHGSFGTGFKAPTLNDLYFPFFSNPDLVPETNRGFDLGIEQHFLDDRLVVDLTWFDLDFEDLIAFDFLTFLPQNIAAATSRGAELTLRFDLDERTQIAFSHTYNDTEDRTTGLQLARRPEHKSVVSVFFRPVDRMRGSITLVAARDSIDSNGSTLDDYELVDVTLRYRLTPAYEPFLRVENLFDQDYQEISGFTAPGVHGALGLSVKF